MQQLPEVGKFDSENEISCLRWIIFNWRRKSCVFHKSDTDYVGITVYRYRNNKYMKDSDIELKSTEYNTLLEKKKYLLSYLETFSKKFIVVQESTHHNWYYFAGRWTSSLLLLLFNLTRDWNFVPHSKKKHSEEKFIFECLSLLGSKNLLAWDEWFVPSRWT